MKFIYTRQDGGLSVVTTVDKVELERVLGSMTDKEYKNHIILRSIPNDSINYREIKDTDIPNTREFREAWCDVTDDSKIDIDLVKAKEIKLADLRKVRDQKLKETDQEFVIALSKGENTTAIEVKKQILRDATNDLKALDVNGYNDEIILSKIKELGQLPSLEEN